jgi:hypothetical protein
VKHKRLMKPACDAQMAKGNSRKLITSGEHSANYVAFSAMYIKILYSNIKITTKLKKLKTVSAHAESTDVISYRRS